MYVCTSRKCFPLSYRKVPRHDNSVRIFFFLNKIHNCHVQFILFFFRVNPYTNAFGFCVIHDTNCKKKNKYIFATSSLTSIEKKYFFRNN